MPNTATLDAVPAPPAVRRPRSRPVAAGDGAGPGARRGAGSEPVPAGVAGPAATDLLLRLRAPGTGRPVVDAALAGGLRAWLEDGAAALGEGSPPLPIVPERSGAPAGAAAGAGAARHLLARTVFRLVVTGWPPRHPFEDALCALSATGAGEAAAQRVRAMSRRDRAALRGAVESDASSIAAHWRRPPASWLARTAERLHVPLAAGAVELRATADLSLGTPSTGTASVCLVEVGAGPPAAPDRRSRRFLALLETLRSGAPPWRVATYDPGSGTLAVDEVTEAILVEAVGDVLGVLARAAPHGGAPR